MSTRVYSGTILGALLSLYFTSILESDSFVAVVNNLSLENLVWCTFDRVLGQHSMKNSSCLVHMTIICSDFFK
jgi:hypothetical protein